MSEFRLPIGLPADLLTPALMVDLDAVDHNIAKIIEGVGGTHRWRPHLKTVKQSRVIGRLISAGISTVKVATLDELALTLEVAATTQCEIDVLVAYPLTPPALTVAVRLARAHPRARISVLADDPDHLKELAVAAPGLDRYIDVDLGMGRTGCTPEQWSARISASPTISGLHGYDGHLEFDQEELAHRGYDQLVDLAKRLLLTRPGAALELVTSGSHSFAHALTHRGLANGPWRHRVSPGTLVFSDVRSVAPASALGLRSAAIVLSRVISSRPDRVTLDAGSKAISPDVAAPCCAIPGWPGLRPLKANEEHLPCVVESDPVPERGSMLALVPAHVCTTVNLHREAVYVRRGVYLEIGPIEATRHGILASAKS